MKSALTASLQSVLSAAVLTGMMMLCGGMPQAFAAPPPDGNIIVDPGFEAPDDLIWTGSETVLLRSSEQARSGKWNLRIQDRSDTASGSANSAPVSVSLQGGGRFLRRSLDQNKCGIKNQDRIPLHHHRATQIGYAVSGHVRFLAENEADNVEASTGDSYVFNAHEMHGTIALEDTFYIEVFAPARDEYKDF